MDFSKIETSELERLLEEYPWFTLARKEYISRKGKDDDELLVRAVGESALFFNSRAETLREIRLKLEIGRSEGVNGPKDDTLTDDGAQRDKVDAAAGKQRVIVVGGDYFGKEDFMELEKGGYRPENDTTFHSQGKASRRVPPTDGEQTASDTLFGTETLANIYEQQQFYDKAIEIYKQLILLYPEKSAYFAARVERLEHISDEN